MEIILAFANILFDVLQYVDNIFIYFYSIPVRVCVFVWLCQASRCCVRSGLSICIQLSLFG